MFPNPSSENIGNGHLMNTIVSSNLVLRPCIDPDRPNLLFGEFGVSVGLSFLVGLCVSFLSHHVAHVVAMCSKKEVGRVHTGGIIAAVKNAHGSMMATFGNFTIGKLPCYAMRFHRGPSQIETSISTSALGSGPNPAAIDSGGLVNFIPEAFGYTLSSHVTSLGSVVRDALGISVPARLAILPPLVSQ